jgi:hypothetical protein
MKRPQGTPKRVQAVAGTKLDVLPAPARAVDALRADRPEDGQALGALAAALGGLLALKTPARQRGFSRNGILDGFRVVQGPRICLSTLAG